MNDKEINSTWGGARKGAGRKATGKQYHVMSITGTKEELDIIRQKAKEANKSISRYVIDIISSETHTL